MKSNMFRGDTGKSRSRRSFEKLPSSAFSIAPNTSALLLPKGQGREKHRPMCLSAAGVFGLFVPLTRAINSPNGGPHNSILLAIFFRCARALLLRRCCPALQPLRQLHRDAFTFELGSSLPRHLALNSSLENAFVYRIFSLYLLDRLTVI
jgi:hypothetical protein